MCVSVSACVCVCMFLEYSLFSSVLEKEREHTVLSVLATRALLECEAKYDSFLHLHEMPFDRAVQNFWGMAASMITIASIKVELL